MYIFFPLPCAKEIFVELIEELDIKPLSRYLRGGCREGGGGGGSGGEKIC